MSSKINYDSEFCGSLPLNHVNLIQSYGYLLVLTPGELTIIQGSENVVDLFGKDIRDAVDHPLAFFCDVSPIRKVQDTNAGLSEKLPLSLTIGGSQYLGLLHHFPGYLILEIEKQPNVGSLFLDQYKEIKYGMAAINGASNLQELYDASLTQLQKLSGFDRMLLYKFDEEWNGTVVAETVSEGLEPYLGLKFPASDIPKQARALYSTNPYRLIPDRDFRPVKLYPVINPVTNAFTDLSNCNLRSVPAVHVEYLRNMGVAASMSTRVIINDALWGLISCHHRTPKFLTYEECAVFELISSVISVKLNSLLSREQMRTTSVLQDQYSGVIDAIYANGTDLASGLMDGYESFVGALGLEGFAHNFRGNMTRKGNVPEDETIEELFLWLQGKNIDSTWSTNQLPSVFHSGVSSAASGLLVIPVDPSNGEYLLGFRPEQRRLIKWGGNPNDRIQFEPDGKKYHPRNSFSMWEEEVKDTSLPWESPRLEVAEKLRSFIFEHLNKNR